MACPAKEIDELFVIGVFHRSLNQVWKRYKPCAKKGLGIGSGLGEYTISGAGWDESDLFAVFAYAALTVSMHG